VPKSSFLYNQGLAFLGGLKAAYPELASMSLDALHQELLYITSQNIHSIAVQPSPPKTTNRGFRHNQELSARDPFLFDKGGPLRFSLTFIYILYWNVKFSILFWSNGEVYSIQLDAIKIVSDIRQVMGFILDNPAFSINEINHYAITDILLTVVSF
jgi:hypothetical protein